MVTLRDIMSENIGYCTPLDNVYEVARKMKEQNVGMIPICDNERVIGVITDRDIVIRGVAERKPNSSSVTEIMSDRLITANPDMTLQETAQLMSEEQVRRLPVVEENQKMVGIVSLGDLATNEKSDEMAGGALQGISEEAKYH